MNTRPRRPLSVSLVSVTRGNETVVGVRRIDNGAAINACVGIGHEGAAHALLAMVQWCIERGHVIASTPLAQSTQAA